MMIERMASVALLAGHMSAHVDQRSRVACFLSQANPTSNDQKDLTSAAQKFKVLTCMSTSCSKRRKDMNMDELSTFSALFTRAEDDFPATVEVEESPCLGSCKMAPCVAIEHEDFTGSVPDPDESNIATHFVARHTEESEAFSVLDTLGRGYPYVLFFPSIALVSPI